jgi:UDP-N-acetylmuramoyl-tripeptide--D-alanyl-D-alanine ligase
MKKLIELKLKILAKMILAKYKPEIIGITGSVGKTSAKEAIYAVLSSKFNAQRSVKNYNNEIGLPLAVIGAFSPGKNIFGWVGVFLKALKLILFKDKKYPKILILEMGADKPGDMEYLLNIVKPKVGVITGIGESHLEFFNSVEDIQKEKELLVKQLPEDGFAVLNYNDGRVKNIFGFKAKKITYGFDKASDARAEITPQPPLSGGQFQNFWVGEINFKLRYNNSSAAVNLPNTIGVPAVSAALAGAAVGIAYGLSLKEISAALKKFKSPKGRMNLISGIKNTLIIDDTYNSSPQSCLAALDAVSEITLAAPARKFAVLGDMLELGSYTEEGHKLVGRKVYESGINKLIAVGEKSRDIARGAEEAGMKPDNIFHFPDSDAARLFVQERIEKDDLILVKGSQGMRMEKIVKEIMVEPLRAEELLVRQGREWKN